MMFFSAQLKDRATAFKMVTGDYARIIELV